MWRIEEMNSPNLDLSQAGIWQILNRSKKGGDSAALGGQLPFASSTSKSFTFGISKYASAERTAVMNLCGWKVEMFESNDINNNAGGNYIEDSASQASDTDSLDGVESKLRSTVMEIEQQDCFERAVAVALLHENIALAVEILRNHINYYGELKNNDPEESSSSEGSDGTGDSSLDDYYGNEITNDYVQLLSLVAMCFAGFASLSPNDNGAGKLNQKKYTTWIHMSKHLIGLLDQADYRKEAVYLSAVCKFLVLSVTGTDTVDISAAILNDSRIFIEDRVAFACVYLSDTQLSLYMQKIGSVPISGLVVCGFTTAGIGVIQAYLDEVQDIQSVGLLIGRYIAECKLPPAISTVGPSVVFGSYDCKEKYWFHEYRLLLNKWQLFMQRASLDVEIAKLQRSKLSGTVAAVLPATVNKQGTGGGRGGAIQKSVAQPRTMYCIPTYTQTPHIYLRCHQCPTSLPLDSTHVHLQADWLRRQKYVLKACPNCKNPLPRCYICHMRVGLLNPQMEYARMYQKSKEALSASSNSLSSSSSADHSILPIGKWLYFCQKCKHGGHSSCIDQWFQLFGQYQCGVNGCSCNCKQ